MKTLYLDCGMGAAGDMLVAALIELHPDREAFVKRFHAAGIPDVEMMIEDAEKCGIMGTHVKMLVCGEEETSGDVHYNQEQHTHHDRHDHDHHHENHHHTHRSMQEIENIVGGLQIEEQVRRDVIAVYHLIAEAESIVHGTEVSEIHFHEVGAMDAIADITAVCMLMHELAPDEVIASPVATGFGAVRCAHGVLPVPAPATALLLKGIPIYAGTIEAELCTPTGAALLKYYVKKYEQMPVLTIKETGYGMGKKDFVKANCLRVFLGETEDQKDFISELSCNVDDMTGEEIGFATERLWAAGAREVYTIPVYMKKNRPGTLLRVLTTAEKREDIIHAIFRYTSTIGIRETEMSRYVLKRQIVDADTKYGTIRRKEVSGYGVHRAKWEYDDIAQIAMDRDCSLREITRELDGGT